MPLAVLNQPLVLELLEVSLKLELLSYSDTLLFAAIVAVAALVLVLVLLVVLPVWHSAVAIAARYAAPNGRAMNVLSDLWASGDGGREVA